MSNPPSGIGEGRLSRVVLDGEIPSSLPPALERVLRLVVVTPGMHKVHHSRAQPETDSNYASLSSVWDTLFRSRRCRADLENILLGLEGKDSPGQQGLTGLLRDPFRGENR